MRRILSKMFNIMIVASTFSACSAPHSPAPLTDYSRVQQIKLNTHVVAPGETLYAIAWRYDLDYVALAKLNKIGADYRIYPGQKINLATDKVVSKSIVVSQKTPKPVPKPVTLQPRSPKLSDSNDRSIKSPTQVKKSPVLDKSNTQVQWQWPAKGKILRSFEAQVGLNKGIDIDGKIGESVQAAADGVVVYAGEGLRGYGRLIIIKHSAKYLSAYAHNSRLGVKEKDQVRRGDKIAEMGNSGTDVVKLHFEIRYDGTPVDPQSLLPPR